MKPTPRLLLIVALAVAAGVVIAAARLFGGPSSSTSLTAPQGDTDTAAVASAAAETTGSTAPSTPAGEDHQHDDDGVTSDPPAIVRPTEKPDVQEAAAVFAAAWLNTYPHVSAETWRARLVDRMTSELAADMADADPASVPAGGKVGNPVQVKLDGSLNTADVPVVTAGTSKPQPIGTLRLTLVNNNGTWLVSEIDWEGRP